MTQPNELENNPDPQKTLEKGFVYLRNVYRIVDTYKSCEPMSSIDNKSIQSVNNMLVTLEFDPNHLWQRNGDYLFTGHGKNYYKLLHSELLKDLRLFIELVEVNIEIPVQRFINSIEQRLHSVRLEMLLDAIGNDNLFLVVYCMQKRVAINFKDFDGRTPLHHAVNNGNIDIVDTLLKNGAEITQFTNNGNTPLHIACSKGHSGVVKLLLQYASRIKNNNKRDTANNKLNDFIDSKTISDGSTALHVAAENGFLEIVKSLLTHGATFNIVNKEGKTPMNFSKDQEIVSFLKLVENLFEEAKKGHAISKLSGLKPDEFLSIINARNNQGNTLYQVEAEDDIKSDQVQSQPSLECELDQLKELRDTLQGHIDCSKKHFHTLRAISKGSGKNRNPWKAVKEGSYYLQNANRIVEIFKDCQPTSSIDNINMQSVKDLLITLEFDPKHITMGFTEEAYGGRSECFVSKGQDTKYYKLLHSDLKINVRSFISMVQPIQKFLESIEQRLISTRIENLEKAVGKLETVLEETKTLVANFKD